MAGPFQFDAQPGHGEDLFDDIANALAFQGGGFAIYQTNDGLPQGGINISQDYSNRAISPTLDLGALGNNLINTTPLYVWLILAVALIGIYVKSSD